MHFEIEKNQLDALIRRVTDHGVTVTEDWNEPQGARFIGTFEGTHITLYPKFDTQFALYFTVAHLYGHMVQMALQTVANENAGRVIGRTGVLTHDEIQIVYEHEREAAAIGRKLMGEVTPLIDRHYHRIFLADFHYLIHFIETGEKGVEVFDRFMRREPLPPDPIAADPRPLVDLPGQSQPLRKVIVI
jgi:hypothetical protein